MVRLRFPRRLAVLLVLASIFSSPVLGAEPRPRNQALRADVGMPLGSHLRDQAWTFLSRLWTKLGLGVDLHQSSPVRVGDTPIIILGEEGCIIDPNGSNCLDS